MDQPFVWLVRELKFSSFHGHIQALGGCILCLGCVDTAWAAISNQKGRGDSSWLAHLRVHMGEQQHLCTHWHLNTKLSAGTGGVQHLRRHTLTKQPFLISSGKALTLVLTISSSWLLWDSPLVGFLMPDLDKHIWRLSSLSLIYITFLLCFFFLLFVCHDICRFLNKRTSLVLNDIFSPGKLSCALHICLSHFQRYQLWVSICIFVLKISQPPSLVTFHCNFQLFKDFAENYGNVWIKIALVRGAPEGWCDRVSWWKRYLQSSVLNDLSGPPQFCLGTILNWQQFVILF